MSYDPEPYCLLCPGECPIPDCPYALRRGDQHPSTPETDEDELEAAHEMHDCGGNE